MTNDSSSLRAMDLLRWPGVVEEVEADLEPIKVLAMQLLEQKVWEIEISGGVSKETREGEFESVKGFTWKIEGDEEKAEHIGDFILLPTTISVSWSFKGKNREVSVVTLFPEREEEENETLSF